MIKPKYFHSISKKIEHLIKAGNAHSLHSPFLFDLYNKLVKTQISLPEKEALKKLRQELSSNQTTIQKRDFGTGIDGPVKVSSMYKSGACDQTSGKLLFNARRFFPGKALELGTQLGVATAHLALADRAHELITVEACPETFSEAKKSLEPSIGLQNITMMNARVEQVVDDLKNQKFNLIYFDANHSKEATINYAKALWSTRLNDSFWFFDDIHWSKGMTEAWEEIKTWEGVKYSVDFGKMGLIGFRQEMLPQHYLLRA